MPFAITHLPPFLQGGCYEETVDDGALPSVVTFRVSPHDLSGRDKMAFCARLAEYEGFGKPLCGGALVNAAVPRGGKSEQLNRVAEFLSVVMYSPTIAQGIPRRRRNKRATWRCFYQKCRSTRMSGSSRRFWEKGPLHTVLFVMKLTTFIVCRRKTTPSAAISKRALSRGMLSF